MRHVHWLSVILLMVASACGASSVDAPLLCTNNGTHVTTITIPAKDGIVLVRE